MKFLQKFNENLSPKILELLDILEKYRIKYSDILSFINIENNVFNKIKNKYNFTKQINKGGIINLINYTKKSTICIKQLEDDYFIIILAIKDKVYYYKVDQLYNLMKFLNLLEKYNLLHKNK